MRITGLWDGNDMNLQDVVLGDLAGSEMAVLIAALLEQQGGVQGVVTRLEKMGLGVTARSWVGPGANEPISAQQVKQAFGVETITRLSIQARVSPELYAQRISLVLPQAIDRLTPAGIVKTA
jgi:uncharacterized protein YidB (DUF937 family)